MEFTLNSAGSSVYLIVNGVAFPAPNLGFKIMVVTTLDGGKNANNALVGQRIGRDQYKLDGLEWAVLPAEVWYAMQAAIEPFTVPVTFEHPKTGERTTVYMYPGNREAEPAGYDPVTNKITYYKNCKFNLIDCGWE